MEATHVLPGRIRLRAPVLIGQHRAADQLQKSLARLDGIRAVEVNPLTGSLLIRFAPDRVRPDMLLGAAIRLLGLEKEIQRPPRSHIGEGIRQAGDSVNRAIHQQTGGIIDLWTSVALLLLAGGVRHLAAGNPQLGWQRLWWAYLSMFPPALRGHS
jgi:cation transport ATPase